MTQRTRELDDAERVAIVSAAVMSLLQASPSNPQEVGADPTIWRFSARWWNHAGSRGRQRPEARRGW
jgi:hypothetical protein